jgi:hypothetical protein
MFNFKQIRLNVNRLVFCTFGFYNRNNKYKNNVLFAFVPMNSLILRWTFTTYMYIGNKLVNCSKH